MGNDEGREAQAVVVGEDGGQLLQFLGNPWRRLISSPESAGRLGVLEASFEPGPDLEPPAGAPLHLHREHEEAFYVVSGIFEFRLGEAKQVLAPGGFVFIPRGVPHGFRNAGTTTGKLLGILIPAGFERFFEEISALTARAGRPDPASIAEVLARHDQLPA